MSITDIVSDAVTYPFSDITKFLIVGVISLLAGLSSLFSSWGYDGFIITAIGVIIGVVFTLILEGYTLPVIKKGIQHSNEIPDIDPVVNLIDGIKVVIIEIVYFIIPIIIAVLFGGLTTLVGAGLNHTGAGLGFGTLIAIIVFIIFSIFEIVAVARFADTGEMSAAFSIGSVIEDAKRIGILNILLFLIIAVIIMVIVSIIVSLLAVIPFIGIILSTIIIGGFVVLFYNKGIGLLYAGA